MGSQDANALEAAFVPAPTRHPSWTACLLSGPLQILCMSRTYSRVCRGGKIVSFSCSIILTGDPYPDIFRRLRAAGLRASRPDRSGPQVARTGGVWSRASAVTLEVCAGATYGLSDAVCDRHCGAGTSSLHGRRRQFPTWPCPPDMQAPPPAARRTAVCTAAPEEGGRGAAGWPCRPRRGMRGQG